jgi:hypothetical protein
MADETRTTSLGEAFADALSRKDGPFVVEQQAYYEERDGRIGWMRVVCSEFRPRPA